MEAELLFALDQVERFQDMALRTSDEGMRSRYIVAVDMIILDLILIGAIDQHRADTLAKTWVKDYADKCGIHPIFMSN